MRARSTVSRRAGGRPALRSNRLCIAAALERGYTPASLISGLSAPIKTLEGDWLPDDHSGGGPMTMRTALRLSSNSAAVGMLMDIGIPTAIHAAERFGIESVPGVPSLALGSGEVTLMAMTAAYAAFANAGRRPQPHLIRRVETADGEVLFSAQPSAGRAVSETTAFLMTSMLTDVLNGGTGSQARRFGFTRPAAGKTGTTNGYRDAWFIGYTPRLATGVWIGYDYPRTIAARGYAATVAVPLWGRFMAIATRNEKLIPFPRPRSVTSAAICRISGKRSTEACQHDVVFDSAGYPSQRSNVYTGTSFAVRNRSSIVTCISGRTSRGLQRSRRRCRNCPRGPEAAVVQQAYRRINAARWSELRIAKSTSALKGIPVRRRRSSPRTRRDRTGRHRTIPI